MPVRCLEECIQAVVELGVLQAVRPLSRNGEEGAFGLVGEVEIAGSSGSIVVDLSYPFPAMLPNISLSPWDALGSIPHVLPSGGICYQDKEGLVLDRRRPSAIVTEALRRAIEVLEAGVSGQNVMDFVDEFDVYWGRISKESIFSALDPPPCVADIVSISKDNGKGEKSVFIAKNQPDLAQFFNVDHLGNHYAIRSAIYVPLQSRALIPPRPDRNFWTVAEVRSAILPLISPESRLELQRISKRRLKDTEVVVFGIPRPAGGVSIFGVRFLGVRTRHPLLEDGKAEHVVPFAVKRLEKGYLVPRGGGEEGLSLKRILLVGGGAIGGYLAFELARAGVLNLTIVDPDRLEPENTFRHILGRSNWIEEKAKALAYSIESQLPYSRVKPIVGNIEQALATGAVDLRSFDLVVLATGNPTVELEVNSIVHRTMGAPPVLFSWLEPYGIGGHALVANNAKDGGCFECLYTQIYDEIDEYLSNRASFAAPNQAFGLSLTGCGNLHTPYGSVAAMQTAALAIRLAIDTLTGVEKGNPLRSWKGPARSFLEAEFKLSARYDCSQEELDRQAYVYRRNSCATCGDRDGDRV